MKFSQTVRLIICIMTKFISSSRKVWLESDKIPALDRHPSNPRPAGRAFARTFERHRMISIPGKKMTKNFISRGMHKVYVRGGYIY